jgi:hypothetical protein
MPIQLNEENGGKILAVHVSRNLVKADYEHFVPEFERLAMVGEKKRQQGMTTFCKPFTKAKTRYFDHTDDAGAQKWLAEA